MTVASSVGRTAGWLRPPFRGARDVSLEADRTSDGELHEVTERGLIVCGRCRRVRVRGVCVVGQAERGAWRRRPEIDQQIGALGRSQKQVGQSDGGVEQAAVGADLVDPRTSRERHVVEAGVGGVDDAETINAARDVEVGCGLAVDHRDVAEGLWRPLVGITGRSRHSAERTDRVRQRAVGVERPILEGERQFAGA